MALLMPVHQQVINARQSLDMRMLSQEMV